MMLPPFVLPVRKLTIVNWPRRKNSWSMTPSNGMDDTKLITPKQDDIEEKPKKYLAL